jgi:hypothetical protein
LFLPCLGDAFDSRGDTKTLHLHANVLIYLRVRSEMQRWGVSKQQHPHVVLKDWEPLLLVVRVHDAHHPHGVEACLREAAGEVSSGRSTPC